jgi:ribosomal protein S18 acetylase RimI-like enzyme
MEFIIRKCEINDLPILVELCQKHAAFEQANYNPNGKQKLLQNAIFSNNPKLFCLIVEINKKIGGFCTYTYDFSTWDAQNFMYMDCLFIEEDFRGHKIGEKIIENLKQIAEIENCFNIQWQTPVFNERAIKFYNRIGGISKHKVRFFIDLKNE